MIGRIRDNSEPKPALDLYFDKDETDEHGWEHGQVIQFDLGDGSPWHGVISRKPHNRVYLRRWLTRNDERMLMRIWLADHGFSHGAVVDLVEESGNRFRFRRG